MATKYWVGGSGTWDNLTNTNWAATSGGVGGSTQAPCSLDDVVFDSASNATNYTVTIATGAVCKNITVAGPASGNVTVDLVFNTSIYVYGDVYLAAVGVTTTGTGAIRLGLLNNQSVTTNGVALSGLVSIGIIGISNSSAVCTLNSSLTVGSTLTLNQGQLNTNGYSLTCGNLTTSATSGTFTLTLGSSIVTVNGTLSFAQAPLLTLNAGTSSIVVTGNTAFINRTGLELTWYDVSFTYTGKTSTNIVGKNIFHNLSFATPATANIYDITLHDNQTINGTLSISGTGAVNRYFIHSITEGTPVTLTAAAIAPMSDVDFRDITAAGAATWSGTRLGNCLGNSGITFQAGANRYIVTGTDSTTWQSNIWATYSGAPTGNIIYFPLAQDTVIINNTLNASATLSKSINYNVGSIDCSARTSAMSLAGSLLNNIYGEFKLSSSVTVTSFGYNYCGRSVVYFDSFGMTLNGLGVTCPTGTLRLQSSLTVNTQISVTAGTLDFNGYNVTNTDTSLGIIYGTGLAYKELKLGSGTITLAGTSPLITNTATGNNNVLTPGTSNIALTSATSIQLGFSSGELANFYNVTCTNALSPVSILGPCTFNNLTFQPRATEGVSSFTLSGNITINGTLSISGSTVPTQRVFITSNTLGTPRTISAGTITGLQNIDFQDIVATGTATWSGTGLGDRKGNTGITFPASKTVYWNLAGTNNWGAVGWAASSGGTPAVNNFPLAQDTAIFDNTGAVTQVNFNAGYAVGTVDMSSRTIAMTFATTVNPSIYGDFKAGTGVTFSGATAILFQGRTTQLLQSSGRTFTQTISLQSVGGTLNLADALTSSNSIVITHGRFNTNNYTVSCTSINSSTSTAREIYLGSSLITLTASLALSTSTNLLFDAGSSTINAGTSVQGRNHTFNNVVLRSNTTINGNNIFNTLSNSTQPLLITWPAGTENTINNFNISGTAGNLVSNVSSIPGVRYTLKKGTVWEVGANSVDYGNNETLNLTGTTNNYLGFKDSILSFLASAINSNFFRFFN